MLLRSLMMSLAMPYRIVIVNVAVRRIRTVESPNERPLLA